MPWQHLHKAQQQCRIRGSGNSQAPTVTTPLLPQLTRLDLLPQMSPAPSCTAASHQAG